MRGDVRDGWMDGLAWPGVGRGAGRNLRERAREGEKALPPPNGLESPRTKRKRQRVTRKEGSNSLRERESESERARSSVWRRAVARTHKGRKAAKEFAHTKAHRPTDRPTRRRRGGKPLRTTPARDSTKEREGSVSVDSSGWLAAWHHPIHSGGNA